MPYNEKDQSYFFKHLKNEHLITNDVHATHRTDQTKKSDLPFIDTIQFTTNLQAQITELRERNNSLTARVATQSAKIGNLEEGNRQLVQGLTERTAEVRTLEDKLTTTSTALRNAQTALRTAKEQIQTLSSTNTALQEKLAEVEAQRAASVADLKDPQGYYRTLGIDPVSLAGRSEEDITRYVRSMQRAQSMFHHPDHKGNQEQMKKINAAYDFLLNPANRRIYGR